MRYTSRHFDKLKSLAILLIFLSTSCSDDSNDTCEIPATVRDFSTVDGACSFIFELNDGTRLDPIQPCQGCEGFSLNNYQFVDGEKVVIGYQEVSEVSSACQVGIIVKLNCLRKLD